MHVLRLELLLGGTLFASAGTSPSYTPLITLKKKCYNNLDCFYNSIQYLYVSIKFIFMSYL